VLRPPEPRRLPVRSNAHRPGKPQTHRPAFAGRFFIALLILALPFCSTARAIAQVGQGASDYSAANDKTPLMTAAQQGDAAAVSRLIAAGADVNASNAGGATALMFGALGGDPAVVSLLVRAGARTDARAKLGWTALALAAVKGHTEAADVLLNAGADQGARDAYGWTPLMRAVDRRRADVVRLLLESPGADLSARQEDGATALHISAASGDLEIVRLLVAHGADRAAQDRNGNTPATIATNAGHAEVAEYLGGIDDD
jgi:ankyrin repeat protein